MKLFLVLLLVLSLQNVLGEKLARKQLAGPPNEFSLYSLPDPKMASHVSSSSIYPIHFQTSFWESQIYVDSDELLVISFFSPYEEELRFQLIDSNGQPMYLDAHRSKGSFPVGDQEVEGSIFTFRQPTQGTWLFQIKANGNHLKAMMEPGVDGYLTVFNLSPVKASAHFNNYRLITGEPVVLEAQIVEENQTISKRQLKEIVTFAELVVSEPDGRQVMVTMEDDGMHFDMVENDDVYTAQVTMKKEGTFRAQTILRGVAPNGQPFMRTTEHYLSVLNDDLDLDGSASGGIQENGRMKFSLGVKTETSDDLRAYAEVYATQEDGKEVPVCWIGGLVNVIKMSGKPVIELEMDLRWLALASAKEPITLRNVIVQDVATWIPLETVNEISVTMEESVMTTMMNLPKAFEITEEMTMGVRPAFFSSNVSEEANGRIVLLHGYCSGSNPWQSHPQDWTSPAYFLNAKASIGHDAFAQRVLSWSSSFGPFSITGHSQGGAVATHIMNYYWSGLDQLTTAGRKVQTLGTPYQGCGIAGTAADFGNLFGVGCGRNDDLTRDGALLWMKGITTKTRQQVYFYTTTYQLGNLFGDYCNLAVNVILAWPNDGVTEYDYATLPGATNLGNTLKQCHTGDMKYPAQYDDHTRNRAINANAAR